MKEREALRGLLTKLLQSLLMSVFLLYKPFEGEPLLSQLQAPKHFIHYNMFNRYLIIVLITFKGEKKSLAFLYKSKYNCWYNYEMN